MRPWSRRGDFAQRAAVLFVLLLGGTAACADDRDRRRELGPDLQNPTDVRPDAPSDARPDAAVPAADEGTATDVRARCGGNDECDDGNPCTADVCDVSGGCVHTPIGGSCDDGDACTADDACQDGACEGRPVACVDADEDPCTEATCRPPDGCVTTCRADAGCVVECAGDEDCGDDDPTSIDLCAVRPCSASCTHYWPPCDDGNPCTADRPDEQGTCQNVPLDGPPCDDGSACTSSDRCVSGECVGVLVSCDDGNPCTADRCRPDTGCAFQALPDGLGCDDGNACTVNDRCHDSACGGQQRTCPDDRDPCSLERCLPAVGCVVLCRHTGECAPECESDADCGDTQPCTIDRCLETTCSTKCEHVPDPCADGDPCTIDYCSPVLGQCVNPAWCRQCASDGDCDDGNVCTVDECTSDLLCEEDLFVTCPDDGDPCTVEQCDPEQGCTSQCLALCGDPCQDDGDCEDVDACTVDRCVEGACGRWCRHEPLACDPDAPCAVSLCLDGACVDSVPAVVPTLDGAIGDDWHPRSLACVELDPSDWEGASLSQLRLQVDDNLLYVGVGGQAAGDGQAIVGYLDVDAGNGRGFRRLSGLSADGGTLDAAVAGCAEFAAEGFEADFAFGTVAMASAYGAADRAGWRRLSNTGALRWMPEGAVVASAEAGAIEAVVTLGALFPDGVPEEGALLSIVVLIAAAGDCRYADQSLPDQPAALSGGTPTVATVHHFVAQPALLNCCSRDHDCRDDDPCTSDVCRTTGQCQHVNTGCSR